MNIFTRLSTNHCNLWTNHASRHNEVMDVAGYRCAGELCCGNTGWAASAACHADRLTLGRLDSGFRRKERKDFEAVFQETNEAGHGLQKKIPQEREFSLCSRVPAFSSIAMAQKKGALISQRSRKLAT
ncbi:MAG: hypothetical protein MJY76_02665, partial [Bacteroidales bacterium]|nr:hypothetical protein [Bacteroidales bacterium]